MIKAFRASILLSFAYAALLTGCFSFFAGREPGSFEPPRHVDAKDVAVPDGFAITAIATGLNLPTGVAEDDSGRLFVTQAGYSYGGYRARPELIRLDGDRFEVVAAGDSNGPWNGVAFHQGAFFVAEGGHFRGGRILRIDPAGGIRTLVEGLPSQGDHHTNGPAIGPDGRVYFGQGTATNSAVVGLDNFDFGWVRRNPRFHDTPCRDLVLRGRNYETSNPLTDDPDDKALTGAFLPFGVKSDSGQVVPGSLPCGGAVMSVAAGGGPLELVAWGFRNPFGLAFSPQGRLFVTTNGYDVRGSRPAWGTADHLWEVETGAWYGWPDYSGNRPIAQKRYRVPEGNTPDSLLVSRPGPPPAPKAAFGVHSSSNGFDFSRSERFGYVGEAFVAQFGDMSPKVGKVMEPVGFKIVRVEAATGIIRTFAANRAGNGPANTVGGGGLMRPIDAKFSRDGKALYVVDFGAMIIRDGKVTTYPGSGVLWKIARKEAP